jgi:hypothetical protein
MAPAPASLADSPSKALKRGTADLLGLDKPVRRRPHRATRPQLVTRAALDGRTGAARLFDKLVGDIETDLGGHDRLSTIQRTLVEAFVGGAVTLHNLNVRLALGQDIDPGTHGAVVSALVRVASRLGVQRVPRDITPDPLSYAREHKDEDAES